MGGSVSLYIGFTLISLLETIVFFAVPRVRKDAVEQDPEIVKERKNPAIKNFSIIIDSYNERLKKHLNLKPKRNIIDSEPTLK